MAITQDQSSSGQLNNTRTAGHDGNATMLVLSKPRASRVDRLTSIDEETQGALDTTLKLGKIKEDGCFTLIKVERMVNL